VEDVVLAVDAVSIVVVYLDYTGGEIVSIHICEDEVTVDILLEVLASFIVLKTHRYLVKGY